MVSGDETEMKLARQFDWNDLETVFKKASEDDFVAAKNGMCTFEVTSVDGRIFSGKCYPTTGAKMVDYGYWKLEKPEGHKYSNVVACSEKGTKLVKK